MKEDIKEKIDKALYCFWSYYLKGLEIINLIEQKDYEPIEEILRARDRLFYNFKTMEFILSKEGINIFEEEIDGISLKRWVEEVSDINTKIQKSSSEILSYYRNNLVKLSCSLKYIKKANTRKESESNFRKEV